MRSAFRRFPAVIACTAIAALGACSDNSAPTLDVVVIGAPTAPFETGVRLSPAGQLVRAATAEGLVTLDAKGQVIPALADRWIVTDDGLSYIFRLRDGLWRDGSPITAETARQALRKAFAVLSGTPLAQEFAAVDEVRIMAGRVIEIRLHRPVPDLLQLLAQPELAMLHKGVGTGPMLLERDGALARLALISPERLGLPQPENWAGQVRALSLRAVSGEDAVRLYGEKKVDIVLGGRFQNYALGQGAAGLSRRDLRIDPVEGVFGLIAARGDGPLGDPAVREALALAIDREALAADLGIRDWRPTTRLVGPGATGDLGTMGERWTELSPERRIAAASARIKRWEAAHRAFPRLALALPDGPGADRLFGRLAADFAAIGVPLARVEAGAAADLQLVDLVARYAGPEWYLSQFTCAARRGLCSPAADARLAEALVETDPGKRAPLLAEAEAELTAANVFIPLGAPVRWSLVRGATAGFEINPIGFHPLAPLAQRPG